MINRKEHYDRMKIIAKNNETTGISAEVAIARSFGVEINPRYEERADQKVVDLLLYDDCVKKIFKKEGLPKPVEHVAEGQNPVDFILEGGETLSVKSNQKALGRVAPQIIGQPSDKTYFEYIEKHFPDFNLSEELANEGMEDTYENRSYMFKKISMTRTLELLNMYWKRLFECDYYLHFFNLENGLDPLENYVLFEREEPPKWDENGFSFSQPLYRWKESITLKYQKVRIGEFQVHRNRNCFKFRFYMPGIIKIFYPWIIF